MPSLGVDLNCLLYTNGYCSSCTSGYYLSNLLCTKIDANCTKFNTMTNNCEACGQGKTPNGANCV